MDCEEEEWGWGRWEEDGESHITCALSGK